MSNLRLKNVAILQAGGTPRVDDPAMWSDDDSTGMPWMSIGDMLDGGIASSASRRVSHLGLLDRNLPIGKAGTVLFAMYASVGSVTELGIEATWNQAILGMTVEASRANQRFLYYWLQSLRTLLPYFYRSNTQDNLNAEQVGNLPFSNLSVGKQALLADYLDAETARIDALIAKKQRMVRLLEEKFWAEVEEVVWRGHDRGMPLKRRTQIDRPIMYGIVLPGPNVPEGIPIMKGGDVAAVRLEPGLLNRTTVEIEAPYARARLRGGDLVVAIRGGIGDVAVVPNILTGTNITQDVARVAPCADLDSSWLRLVLRSYQVRADIQSRVTGATIRGLNIESLKEVRIPSSGPERQSQDMAILDPIVRHVDEMTKSLRKQLVLLNERRQALITAAVTGQLDIPEVV